MGHLGLTPQSVNALAGYRVQGRREDDAVRIVEDARRLEALGCFSIVLECVPSALGARITQALTIPTIGVGAGIHCDGQVLVLQDLLGLTGGHRPKFVRTYLDGNAGRARCGRPLRPRRQAGRLPRGRPRATTHEGRRERRGTRRAPAHARRGRDGLRADARRAARGARVAAAAREGGECARLGQHLRQSRAVRRSRRPRVAIRARRNGTSRCCAMPAATSCSCRARTRSTATAIAIA